MKTVWDIWLKFVVHAQKRQAFLLKLWKPTYIDFEKVAAYTY